MKSNIKKIMAVLTATAVGVGLGSVFSHANAEEILLASECEALTLSSDAVVTTKVYNDEYPGYTGDGFVWVANAGTMSFTVDAPEAGMYRLMSRCIMYLGSEGETREAMVSVERADGTTWSKTVKIAHTDTWNDYSFGDIKLAEGENTITFGGGWGYCLYDSMTLSATPKVNYQGATSTLNDSLATTEAKSLMGYLKSIYGEHTLSGQQEIYGGGNDGNMELEFEWIQENTGKQPAIRGFDFMNYNPLYGWEDGTTERAIDWCNNKNGIVTASWHINVPIDFENYELGDAVDWQKCSYKNYQSSNSTFNTANVVVEGTKEYEYFQLAMEDLAEQLLILQENNVPVIFRPLHEAQGNEGNYGDGTAWFWWGDRGPEVYKEVWKLLYTTLTEKYGLHNLIWEFNSYNYSNSTTWYPGDEYVDLVAYDKYNVDYNRDDGLSSGPNVSAISAIFHYLVELTEGEKMVAMSENDTVPTVENMTVEDAKWLYFCPWYGEHLMSERYQDPETLSETYNSEFCITLDELPDDWKTAFADDSATSGTTTPVTTTTTKESGENITTTTTVSSDSDNTTTSTTVTTTTSGSEEEKTTTTVIVPDGVYIGDVNLDGGLSMGDMVALNKYLADLIQLNDQQMKNADCYSDSQIAATDATALLYYLIEKVDTLPILPE